jgi:hypothetical protein
MVGRNSSTPSAKFGASLPPWRTSGAVGRASALVWRYRRDIILVLTTFLITAVVSVFSTLFITRVVTPPWLQENTHSVDPLVAPAEMNVGAEGPASVVLMNWKREDNMRHIATTMAQYPFIGEVLIWNANNKVNLRDLASNKIKVVQASQDLGLHSRFAMASLASYKRVIVQDDDLMLSVEGMRTLLQRHSENPSAIHGVWGRWPTKESPYSTNEKDTHKASTKAPIVLTRALVASKESVGHFFTIAPKLEYAQVDAKPRWNGEDILFSLATYKANGALNVVHHDLKAEVQYMNMAHGISGQWGSHAGFRERFTKQCYEALEMSIPSEY